MGSRKRAKARGTADPAPLDPEARARLESQVAGVVRALETEVEPAALKAQVSPDPQDPDWDAHLMAALGALSHPAIPPLLAALFGRGPGQGPAQGPEENPAPAQNPGGGNF